MKKKQKFHLKIKVEIRKKKQIMTAEIKKYVGKIGGSLKCSHEIKSKQT